MSLHTILDELDGVVHTVAAEAKTDLAPLWGLISRLRTHADTEAAVLEQHGAADLKQLLHDAETAAAPVVQDLAKETAADVESAVTPTPAPEAPAAEPTPAPAAPAGTPAPEAPTTPAA